MDVFVVEKEQDNFSKMVMATCRNKRAFIRFSSCGIHVVCLSGVTARALRNCKTFFTLAEALAAYKSPEMKAIIAAAAEA